MTPHDRHRQILWETEGYRVARAAYRASAQSKEPGDMPGSQRMLREVVPPLAAALSIDKLDAMDAASRRGITPLHGWVVQEFSPEVMAITAVCCAMRALSMTSEVGYRTNGGLASRICLSIGARLREQMEYDRYARSDHPSLAAFASRYPEVNRRVWARWRRKLREVREAPWPLPVVQATGGLLLRRLCDVAPDRFTLSLEAVGRGHRAAVLLLSQETAEMLNDIEERAAVARPMLLPMRVPPIPWRYQE